MLFIWLPEWSPVRAAGAVFGKFTYVGHVVCLLNLGCLAFLWLRFVEPPRAGVGGIPGDKPEAPSVRWCIQHLIRTRAWVSYVLSAQNNYNNQAIIWSMPLVTGPAFGWGQVGNSGDQRLR